MRIIRQCIGRTSKERPPPIGTQGTYPSIILHRDRPSTSYCALTVRRAGSNGERRLSVYRFRYSDVGKNILNGCVLSCKKILGNLELRLSAVEFRNYPSETVESAGAGDSGGKYHGVSRVEKLLSEAMRQTAQVSHRRR